MFLVATSQMAMDKSPREADHQNPEILVKHLTFTYFRKRGKLSEIIDQGLGEWKESNKSKRRKFKQK